MGPNDPEARLPALGRGRVWTTGYIKAPRAFLQQRFVVITVADRYRRRGSAA
jgi:hypothetical protein